MFPMTLAGISFGGEGSDGDSIKNPLCICQQGLNIYSGLNSTFWDPSRMIDTVSEPYQFMVLDSNMGGSSSKSKLGGATNKGVGKSRVFSQVHLYTYPVWSLLDMFTDVPCISSEEFDIPLMTEIIPTWNDDVLAMLINPEAILFGNPVTQAACISDAMAATSGFPIDYLFWCMGSWGNAYPLAGSITSTDYLEANAGLAARGLYLASRSMIMLEDDSNGCTSRYAPIWKKSDFRLQLAKPIRSSTCLPIGRDALLWGAGKHDFNNDNFLWTLFRKRRCCARVYP